ncbi:MAG: hypothetical protein ABFD50_11305 [Smithella sp.]
MWGFNILLNFPTSRIDEKWDSARLSFPILSIMQACPLRLLFSNKYHPYILVWYEYHETMISAIETEKKIKRWERQWKIDMIEKVNPNWEDLDI